MNPVDADKSGIGFLRQTQSSADASQARPAKTALHAEKRGGDQLIDLLNLIRTTPELDSAHSARLEQLKASVRSDTYHPDLDLLTDNVVAFYNE